MGMVIKYANERAKYLDGILRNSEQLSKAKIQDLCQDIPRDVELIKMEDAFFDSLFMAVKIRDNYGGYLTLDMLRQIKNYPAEFDLNMINPSDQRTFELLIECYSMYRLLIRLMRFTKRLAEDFYLREIAERKMLERYLILPERRNELLEENNEISERLKQVYAEKDELEKKLNIILLELATKDSNPYIEHDAGILPDDVRKINKQAGIRQFPLMQKQSPQEEPVNLAEDVERKPKTYTLDDINRKAAEDEKLRQEAEANPDDFENYDEQDALEGDTPDAPKKMGRPKKEILEKEPETPEVKKKDIFEQVLEPEPQKVLPSNEEILKTVYERLKQNPVGLRMSDLGYPKDVIISAIKSDVQKKYLKYSDGGTLQKSWINTGWNFPKGG